VKKPVTATSIKETETTGGIVEQVPEPAWLFYVLSFIVPIAGIVIGAIYFTKVDEELKRFGKTCLIVAAISIALLLLLFLLYILFVIIMCVLSIFMVFAFYIFVALLIIIAALMAAVSPATSAVAGAFIAAIL
jgi:hypothetical protein